MSTRSNIAIRLSDEHKDKVLVFNRSLVPDGIKVDKYDEADVNNLPEDVPIRCITAVFGNTEFAAIYCHYDGYPSCVGETLLKHYKTTEQVLNLLAMGALSYLTEEHVLSYAHWSLFDKQRQEQNKRWSSVGDAYEPIHVICTNNKEELLQEEYCYLFDNGKWYWATIHSKNTKMGYEDISKSEIEWKELTLDDLVNND